MLQDLENSADQRQLIPIEKRMRKSIISWLKDDEINEKELFDNTNWNVDGKNFREIMNVLGLDSMYPYVFGIASHHVPR